MRITVYESISNTVSAITIGMICGMLVSASLIAQYYTILNLPV